MCEWQNMSRELSFKWNQFSSFHSENVFQFEILSAHWHENINKAFWCLLGVGKSSSNTRLWSSAKCNSGNRNFKELCFKSRQISVTNSSFQITNFYFFMRKSFWYLKMPTQWSPVLVLPKGHVSAMLMKQYWVGWNINND